MPSIVLFMIIGWVRSLSQMGDKKSLEFNKGAMKRPRCGRKTVATSTERWFSWERFVTTGWQSCFSTYNAKSSLIIRSKEKWPGGERGRGLLGLLQGSTCYYLCICLGSLLQMHSGIIFWRHQQHPRLHTCNTTTKTGLLHVNKMVLKHSFDRYITYRFNININA